MVRTLTGAADVVVADGVTEIKDLAFYRCEGLDNLRFLKDSAITTVGNESSTCWG